MKPIVLYISETRISLNILEDILNNAYYEYEKFHKNNLKNFVQGSAKNLSHASHIFIDLKGLLDNDSEILESVNILSNVYSETRVVILADEVNNIELLRRLYNKGIYNIITNLTTEEIRTCLVTGKTKEDGKEFEIEKPVITGERPKIKLFKEESPEVKEMEVIEKIMANKSFRNFKSFVSVAITGAEPHIGVTYNALSITKFLNEIGFKACYLEANSVKKIFNLKIMYPNLVNVNERKNLIQMKGVDIYSNFKISEVLSEKYDFYIFDFGTLNTENLDSYLTKDIKILVAGTKAWELPNLVSALSLIGNKNHVNIFLNQSVVEERSKILNMIAEIKQDYYFTSKMPFPIQYGIDRNIYKSIFKDFVIEEKPEVKEKKKAGKSFFSKFGGK